MNKYILRSEFERALAAADRAQVVYHAPMDQTDFPQLLTDGVKEAVNRAQSSLTEEELLTTFEKRYNALARSPTETKSGYIMAMAAAYPDNPTIVKDARDFFGLTDGEPAVVPPSLEVSSIDRLVGVFYAVSDLGALAELIRRAVNRDGSTESLQDGLGAFALLNEALKNRDFEMFVREHFEFPKDRVSGGAAILPRFGAWPAGSIAPQKKAAGRTGGIMPLPPNVVFESRPTGSAVVAAPPPLPATFGSDVAIKEGTIVVCGKVFPVGLALGLSRAIVQASRSLTLPGEGYAWVDDTADPQAASVLVLFDVTVAPNLPDYEGPVRLGQPAKVQATISQRPNGQYYGTCWDYDGTSERNFTGLPDVDSMKVVICNYLRSPK